MTAYKAFEREVGGEYVARIGFGPTGKIALDRRGSSIGYSNICERWTCHISLNILSMLYTSI